MVINTILSCLNKGELTLGLCVGIMPGQLVMSL